MRQVWLRQRHTALCQRQSPGPRGHAPALASPRACCKFYTAILRNFRSRNLSPHGASASLTWLPLIKHDRQLCDRELPHTWSSLSMNHDISNLLKSGTLGQSTIRYYTTHSYAHMYCYQCAPSLCPASCNINQACVLYLPGKRSRNCPHAGTQPICQTALPQVHCELAKTQLMHLQTRSSWHSGSDIAQLGVLPPQGICYREGLPNLCCAFSQM